MQPQEEDQPCTVSFHNLDYSVTEPLHLRLQQQYRLRKQQRKNPLSSSSSSTTAHTTTKINNNTTASSSSSKKHILKGVSGICRPGEITAILGPTGGGKTSLLDVLAGRRVCDQGSSSLILVNGAPPRADFTRMTGYCEQQDCLLGTLTVRESLLYSAELRLSSQAHTHAEKVKRVDEVIDRLGLRGCAESLVGTELLRGISGGEKKRTNLGRELVTDPKIIFLDEPTTGLDAKTAGTVIEILADLAKNKQKTVVLSIHQPKYSIWKRFDALILLHEGRVAYHGPAHGHTHTGTQTPGGGALMYFEKLGFERELENNPADWLLEVVSLPAPLVHAEGEIHTHTHAHARMGAAAAGGSETGSSEEEEEERGDVEMGVLFSSNSTTVASEDETKDATEGEDKKDTKAHTHTHTTLTTTITSSSLTDIYLLSPEYLHLQQQLSTLLHQSKHTGAAKVSPSSPYANTLLEQTLTLCRRTLLSSLRNPASAFMQFGAMFFFILLIGSIYWQMDLGPHGLQNRVGAFFLLVMMCMFSNLSALELFIQERAVYVHERANGCYRPGAYFWAKSLCDIVPLRVLPGVVFSACVYNMMGLRSGFEHFCLFTVTVLLTMLCAASMCLVLSSWIPVFAVANLAVALLFILFMVTGGILINFSQLPSWLLPFKYVSVFRYAMELLSVNELHGLEFACGGQGGASGGGGAPGVCLTRGDDYLLVQGYPKYEDLWQNLLVLVAVFAGCMCLTYWSLRKMKL